MASRKEDTIQEGAVQEVYYCYTLYLVPAPQRMPHDVDVGAEAGEPVVLLVLAEEAVVVVPGAHLIRRRVVHRVLHLTT